MSPLGSVFRTAVPSILLLESETELHFHKTPSDEIKLSIGAAQLLNTLDQYGKLNLSDVVKLELSKAHINSLRVAKSRFDPCSRRSLHKVWSNNKSNWPWRHTINPKGHCRSYLKRFNAIPNNEKHFCS